MHGNTGSRARAHRVDLYLVLRALDYHVICFDYRGYADSSPVIPSKRGVITDGRAVLQYIRQWADKSPILVWGHSLGTAVSSAIVADLVNEVATQEPARGQCASTYLFLPLQDKAPSALILESPFNNIRDEISIHPMTFLWRKMPYFHWFFTGSLHKSDVAFFSDKCIQEIHIPILILHAKARPSRLPPPRELQPNRVLHCIAGRSRGPLRAGRALVSSGQVISTPRQQARNFRALQRGVRLRPRLHPLRARAGTSRRALCKQKHHWQVGPRRLQSCFLRETFLTDLRP